VNHIILENWSADVFYSPSVPIDVVGLTTFDPWVGNLKFRWLDILHCFGAQSPRDLRCHPGMASQYSILNKHNFLDGLFF
jgi:hypothetical protein